MVREERSESESRRLSRLVLRKAVLLALDLLILLAAFACASLLVGYLLDEPWRWHSLPILATLLAFTLTAIARDLYAPHPRYFGLIDLANLVLSWLAGTVVLTATSLMANPAPANWTVPILTSAFALPLLGAARGLRTARAVWIRGRLGLRRRGAARVMLIGAGDAGDMVLRDMLRSTGERHVVGVLDDDAHKHGTRLHGVRVLGPIDALPRWVEALRVDDILIAIPSADGPTMRRIVGICRDSGVKVRTLPEVSHMPVAPTHLSHQFREIEVEDLLRRAPVHVDGEAVGKRLAGASVLITGAGGSIGSELARQIASAGPARLILLGRGENSIFEIQQELIQTLEFTPTCVIADVRDERALRETFERYSPDLVLHAAAHKHVPLMQDNPLEAIRNNVVGTMAVARMADAFGTHSFVYVSTDKAVKPTSVMGATKRVGELLVAGIAETSVTQFSIVRFGNVLGSRGSLIPALRNQIRRGGPVRVTHQDMTRYFMTIPEAASLILQASALGSRSEIFLLDMGEPIRILDLAEELIELHGLRPREDIDIIFTGIRPGEKIEEELMYENEVLRPTRHPKIRVVEGKFGAGSESVRQQLAQLLQYCDEGDAEAAQNCLFDIAWASTDAPVEPVR